MPSKKLVARTSSCYSTFAALHRLCAAVLRLICCSPRSNRMDVNFTHPANAGVRRHLERRDRGGRAPASRLWDELGAGLPPCAWVVHPATGVLFGFAQGTGPYALRLPPKERAAALAAAGKKAEEGADRLRLSGADRQRYVARHTGRAGARPGRARG